MATLRTASGETSKVPSGPSRATRAESTPRQPRVPIAATSASKSAQTSQRFNGGHKWGAAVQACLARARGLANATNNLRWATAHCQYRAAARRRRRNRAHRAKCVRASSSLGITCGDMRCALVAENGSTLAYSTSAESGCTCVVSHTTRAREPAHWRALTHSRPWQIIMFESVHDMARAQPCREGGASRVRIRDACGCGKPATNQLAS